MSLEAYLTSGSEYHESHLEISLVVPRKNRLIGLQIKSINVAPRGDQRLPLWQKVLIMHLISKMQGNPGCDNDFVAVIALFMVLDFIAINRLLKCMSQFYWCSFTKFSTGDTAISQEILILSSQTCTTKCGTLFVSLRVMQWRSVKDTTATVSNTRHAREFCAACGAFWYISNISHLRYLVILVYSKCV